MGQSLILSLLALVLLAGTRAEKLLEQDKETAHLTLVDDSSGDDDVKTEEPRMLLSWGMCLRGCALILWCSVHQPAHLQFGMRSRVMLKMKARGSVTQSHAWVGICPCIVR